MADRKARLAALAARAGRTQKTPTDQGEHSATTEEPTAESTTESSSKQEVTFRNYVPQDASLEASKDPGADEEEPPGKRPRTSREQRSALEEALEQAQKDVSVSKSDVTAMGPKKINWDLKRDIQAKLDKLERRTQRAIVSLLKERLQKEAEQADSDDEQDLD